MRSLRRLAALAFAVTLSLAAVAPATASATASGTGLALLARLVSAPEHTGGYARTLFVHWIDADRDGCDTREEVLIQESRTTPHVGPGCSVSGSWRSAYDGVTTTRASAFDIDHVVPLKEAWDSGAWAWDPPRRRAYANDLGDSRTLRAVSAASNRAKGDRDPAQWLPPLVGFRCTYATEWVVVKVRWSLSVDTAERDALHRILASCPARTVSVAIVATPSPTSPASPATTPSPAPAPTATATADCDPDYSGYCVTIVSYDLDCSDIRHRVIVIGVDIHHFDGDRNGVGCERYP